MGGEARGEKGISRASGRGGQKRKKQTRGFQPLAKGGGLKKTEIVSMHGCELRG